MNDRDLTFTPAWELRELLGSRKVSAVELTELYLRRIEKFNPKLNAFLTVTAEEALSEARTADTKLAKGEQRSPLLGIPISIKDLEITKGIRSTMGSLIFKDVVPNQDSAVVERIRGSGAIILGKTNTPEFGLSGTTENRLGDACRNPWNIERTSGGSSGGAAAALAAGLCPLATGSDGGGSIRIPSSFCGLYGIKPTLGRVPRYGGFGEPSPNLTSQSGPMARNVRDATILLQVLSGYDSRDPISIRETPLDYVADLDQGVQGLRLAWSRDLGYAAVDAEVVDLTSQGAKVFQELGCSVEEPSISLDYPMNSFLDIFATNAYASYGNLYQEYPELLSDYVRENLDRGQRTSGADYARALLAAHVIRAKLDDLFEGFDLLITPTMAVSAFPVGQQPKFIDGREVHPRYDYMPFTPVFNLTGQPAASIPCGFTNDGMPVGLHIIGRRGEESTVLRASAAFEQARPWDHIWPTVS